MSTPAMDYNQQLLAYLQTWRQLLDQWTTMAAGSAFPTVPPMPSAPAGGPFMPPAAPFMPPMPPPMPPPTASAPSAPPAPGDYAQQLFGYLQAWRQYLEQMAGAGPQPRASTGASDNRPAKDGGTSPLGNGPGGESTSRSGTTQGSDATLPPPPLLNIPPSDMGGTQLTSTSTDPTMWPPLVDIPPGSYVVSQISGPGFDPGALFDQPGHDEPLVLQPPGNDFGTAAPAPRRGPAGPPRPQPPSGGMLTPGAIAQHSAGTAFQSAMDRLDTTAVREAAPKSLFSTPGAETPSARLRDAGEKPAQQ